jgi:hypothetical protein
MSARGQERQIGLDATFPLCSQEPTYALQQKKHVHSINSSARSRNDEGTLRPSAFAVLRLATLRRLERRDQGEFYPRLLDLTLSLVRRRGLLECSGLPNTIRPCRIQCKGSTAHHRRFPCNRRCQSRAGRRRVSRGDGRQHGDISGVGRASVTVRLHFRGESTGFAFRTDTNSPVPLSTWDVAAARHERGGNPQDIRPPFSEHLRSAVAVWSKRVAK